MKKYTFSDINDVGQAVADLAGVIRVQVEIADDKRLSHLSAIEKLRAVADLLRRDRAPESLSYQLLAELSGTREPAPKLTVVPR